MSIASRVVSAFVCVFAVQACSEKDETAPPAPWVDPVASPTSDAVVVLTGAAEYGAKVRISGGASTVEVHANDFTALFRAEVPLNTSIPTGAVSVTNSLQIVAIDDAGNQSEATALEIVYGPKPGEPSTFDLTLTGAAADGTINAGDEAPYDYEVLDAYGEPAVAPVLVVTTSPSAIIVDDGLSGSGSILNLTRIGTYVITARVAGTALREQATLVVTHATGQRSVELVTSVATMATGDTVDSLVLVRDIYGNIIPNPALGFSIDTSGCSSPSTCVEDLGDGSFIINEVGIFAITATYTDSQGTFSDVAYVGVQPVIDVYPPQVAIQNVTVGGNACPASPCTAQPGDQVTFEVTASDQGGLAQLNYGAFFESTGTLRSRQVLVPGGSTSYTIAFSFGVPGGAGVELVPIVAQAIDAFGNIANSPGFVLDVQPISVQSTDGKSRVITTVAAPVNGVNPEAAIYDDLGRLLIADTNNNAVLISTSFSGTNTLNNLNAFGSPNPEFMALDSQGNVYVSVRGNTDGVVQIDAGGSASLLLDVNNDVHVANNLCDPGNGDGRPAIGVAVLPMKRGKVLLGPNQPAATTNITMTDLTPTTKTFTFGTNVTIGADLCATRTNLKAAYDGSPFSELVSLSGPCLVGGFAALELLASNTFASGSVSMATTAASTAVTLTEPVALSDTLFFGSDQRYAFQMNAANPDACYDLRHDLRGGLGNNFVADAGVAAMYQGNPGHVILYAADNGNGTVDRLDLNNGTLTQASSAVQNPTAIVAAPSGCVLVAEQGAGDRLAQLDTRACSSNCTLTSMADGFNTIQGLSLDDKDVIAERASDVATVVALKARLAGAAGNSLALADTSAAISTSGAALAGGATSVRATGSVTVTGTPSDGDTVTVGAHVYELDTASNGVVAGRVPVRPAGGASPTAVQAATALHSAIRQTEARLLVTDTGVNAIVELRPSLDTNDCF